MGIYILRAIFLHLDVYNILISKFSAWVYAFCFAWVIAFLINNGNIFPSHTISLTFEYPLKTKNPGPFGRGSLIILLIIRFADYSTTTRICSLRSPISKLIM